MESPLILTLLGVASFGGLMGAWSLYQFQVVPLRQQKDALLQQNQALLVAEAKNQNQLELLQQQQEQSKELYQSQLSQYMESFLLKYLGEAKQGLEEKADKEFKEKQTTFEKRLEEMLKPLTTTVETYKKDVLEIQQTHHNQTTTVMNELKRLAEVNGRLSTALNHNKGRGDWGELELERLLEESGLTEGMSYLKQKSFGAEKKHRPDIQILLPEGRSFFIDAKAIQIDLNDLPSGEETLQVTQERQTRYAKSLKDAVERLSGKEYQQLIQESADFVVLYVPRESMMAQALAADQNLFEWAFKKQIILAGPFNLGALLKIVHHSWVMARLSDHATKILGLGTDLQKQAVVFTEKFSRLSHDIDTLTRHYHDVWTSFDGQKGFIKQVQKLEAYGCKGSKSIPETIDLPEGSHVLKTPLEENKRIQPEAESILVP